MNALPEPEVVSCYFDDGFSPRLAAMCLRWPTELQTAERIRNLPAGMRLVGPLPERFGLSILREDVDAYAVCLVWDKTAVSWLGLPRMQLANCDLKAILGAMGSDLLYILDQPVLNKNVMKLRAA